MRKNKVIEKLKRGECVSVINIGFFPFFSIVEIAGKIGFDCVWLDMEHRSFGLKELSEMTLACRATNMEAMVRIIKGNYTSVMKPLETGATGLMIPHCFNDEEARQFVNWAKYSPKGKRGFDNAGPDADYLMADPLAYIKQANEETFIVVQIEDKEAVECIDKIAEVDGIDILFIGPADLSLSYGVPFQFEHETLRKAIDRVAEVADKNGKWWGVPIGSVEYGKRMIDKGARFLAHGADLVAIKDGFLKYKEVFNKLGI